MMQFKRFSILLIILSMLQISVCGCSKQTLSIWIGNYTFEEVSPDAIEENPYIMRVYTIDIYEKGDKLIANITINGFQIAENIYAKVAGNSEKIDLIFSSEFSSNTTASYDDGDIILTFEKNADDIVTVWGKMQPMIIDNIESGIYFQKNNETSS